MERVNLVRLAHPGPPDPEHGFPMWFEDGEGVRLELGLGPDPRTPAIGDIPHHGQPLTIPDNFPDEAFYFLAEARMDVGGPDGPTRARLVLALEAAFGGTGEPDPTARIVFSRIRVDIRDVVPHAPYEVTHPYGETRVLYADDDGRVFDTEDRGIGDQQFGLVVTHGLVAPFLRWDSDLPPDHLGDGVTPHRVTGSPFTTNLFRVKGPGVGLVPGAPPGAPSDVAETDLFTVQGRRAQRLGAEVTSATYTRDAAGSVQLDVFARSAPGQPLAIAQPHVPLAQRGRIYAGRASVTAPPSSVTVVNLHDEPPTRVTAVVNDQVTIAEASWSASAQQLTVTAHSSDATGPTLHVDDIGPMTAATTSFPAEAAAAFVTVTSAAGGRATHAVSVTGDALPTSGVRAIALAPDAVVTGSMVTLDGSHSLGAITAYAWQQTAGAPVALSDTASAAPTFTAPAPLGPVTFVLTVQGEGGPSTDDVTLTVQAVPPRDQITVTRSEFRTSRQQYRVSGTLVGTPPSEVTVTRLGAEVGRSAVDATGAWDVRITLTPATAALRPGPLDSLHVSSPGGGSADTAITIRN